ncbi:unnamed protein product [Cyclocybe aegerita]|uniref:Uncharacterized protein n=1 Tax=Cyclocybe aegerita TaxID=1973307 RepID=A0A8S0XE82_CYCAE|nr:unnamed protein product [Cyclocybe aegerita]
MARRPSYPSAAAVPVDPASEGTLPPNGNYQVLDPGYGPQTIHRSELLFINSTPRMNSRQNGELSPQSSTTSPSISSQLYPYHQQAFYRYAPASQPSSPPPPAATYVRNVHVQYPEYVQRAFTSPQATQGPPPPPVPPKPAPITSPTLGTSSAPVLHDISYPPRPQSYQTFPVAPPNAPPPVPPHEPPALPPLPPPIPIPESQDAREAQIASPVEDGDELAMVLALSQSESVQRQKMEEKLLDQEEQDLARALAESLLSTGTHLPDSSNPFFLPSDEVATSSRVTLDEPKDEHSPTPTPALPPPVPQEAAAAAQNPWASASSGDSAEFGRYDKWRIPPLPEKLREEPPIAEDETETSKGKRPMISEGGSQPEQAPQADSPRRPLSASSVSMLPYTLPSPGVQDDSDGGSGSEDAKSLPPMENSTSAQTSGAFYNVDVLEQTESDTVLVFDDEAYARQLAAEEEELLRQELESRRGEKGNLEASQPQEPEGQDLPLYTTRDQQLPEWQATELYSELYSNNRPRSMTTPQRQSSIQPHPLPTQSKGNSRSNYPSSIPENQPASFARRGSDAGIASSTPNAPPYASPFPIPHPSLGNRRESEPDTRSDASHHSSTYSAASAPAAYYDRPTSQSVSSSPAAGPSNASQPAHLSAPVAVNPNHFLDRELLMGVSIGFKPPVISAKLLPMQDPMPNIISLPYARCPPLHFQGPDWRHLLRLMARLSGTRIEPTVEAMAICKTELKLRTVVQFVKPHSSSNTWRTVLWFSIDHPIPPAAPGASRYLTGNPNLLPWSYTLSPIPMLLRDAADTLISKAFTIPVTDAVPLPTLPITFPNLALYLQAALDASRRHSDANGHGKLGRMVQMCYPHVEETHSDFDIPDRRGGVERLFKRVIGRSNKEKKKGKSTNNEETYQLVTPFVPDEWGA